MNTKKSPKLPVDFIAYVILLLLASIPYGFSYILADNFYKNPNLLQPLFEALGNPLWLTTPFIFYSGCCLLALVCVVKEPKGETSTNKYKLIGATLLLAIYTAFEKVQSLDTSYMDNHEADIFTALMAYIVFLITIVVVQKLKMAKDQSFYG